MASAAGLDCRCSELSGNKLMFYNRIPKCGSSTLLTYIAKASKSKGHFSAAASRKKLRDAGCYVGVPPRQVCRTPRRVAFGVFRSSDYEASHFHPDDSTSRAIATNMTAQARGHSALFERHIHYIDFRAMGFPNPVYINLLRDPAALHTSSFYFFRDCICDQQPRKRYLARGNRAKDFHAWCRADWHRKSSEFCSLSINQCYDDYAACQRMMPPLALGGTVGIDFFCGTHADCDGPLEEKLKRAKANLRDMYTWVGILERLQESLRLLQRLLPDEFGAMDATKWSDRVYQPEGAGGKANGTDVPTPATLARMKAHPLRAAEYDLYHFAENLLDCKLRACRGARTKITF